MNWIACLGPALLAACAATPDPVPPNQCSSTHCPVRFVVIAEPEPDPVAVSVSAGESVVDAIEESDAGEVEWMERSDPYQEEPSP